MKTWNVFSTALALLCIAAIAVLLTSCVSMEAPKSFNEKLAYAYAGVASTRSTAASMLERKRISVEEARQMQAGADKARAALDLARGAQISGDMTTAQGQLDLAMTVLTQLEAYLKARQ